jgi:hypothetical protein
VSVAVADNEGCSTALLFTGQTAYCTGSPSAAQTQAVQVAYPGVRLKCPKRAKPEGCKFKLQAISAKPKRGRSKPKVESALARAKLRAGHSAIVTLKPKPKFAARLAAASKVLIKEAQRIHGASKTIFRRLIIVQ